MPSPAATARVQISAMATATAEPLPSVGGYSGQVLLLAGSGTATLTYSTAAPIGVPPLVQNSAAGVRLHYYYRQLVVFAYGDPGLQLVLDSVPWRGVVLSLPISERAMEHRSRRISGQDRRYRVFPNRQCAAYFRQWSISAVRDERRYRHSDSAERAALPDLSMKRLPA